MLQAGRYKTYDTLSSQPEQRKVQRVKICCVRRDFFFNCGNVLVTNYVPLQAVASYVLHSYLACGQAVGFVPKS